MNVMANIHWPENDVQALKHYIGFMIKLLENIPVDYSNLFSSPLPVMRGYLAGDNSEEDARREANEWRSYMKKNGYMQDFKSPNALKARFALLALGMSVSAMQEKVDVGEHVEWAMLCCDKLVGDDKKSLDIFDSYFKFK
jgi:hypothetical protein